MLHNIRQLATRRSYVWGAAPRERFGPEEPMYWTCDMREHGALSKNLPLNQLVPLLTVIGSEEFGGLRIYYQAAS